MSSNSPQQGQYPDSWPLSVDQKALAHASERLHFQRPDDLATNPVIPDDVVRSKTAELFDKLEGVKTPEQIELINTITAQYESSVETWTKLNIPTDGIQTKQEVTAWLNNLPAKTLENLAAYGEVRLKFIPPVKALELLKVIGDRIKAIEDRSFFYHEGWRNVGTKEWEFGLTTDKEDMPLDPKMYYINGVDDKDGTRKNEAMVGLYEQKYQNEGLDIMPPEAAVPSAADALGQSKFLSCRFSFKRLEGAGNLLCAVLHFGEMSLSSSHSDLSDRDLRTRPWVRGEKV